jgi:hypothetical protein
MDILQIKQAILALNSKELRELNNFTVDRARQIRKETVYDFKVGDTVKVDGEDQYFKISKCNRTKAKCVTTDTNETWNIPFSMMTKVEASKSIKLVFDSNGPNGVIR